MNDEELKKLRESTERLAGEAAESFYLWRKNLKKAEKMAKKAWSFKSGTDPHAARAACEALHTASIKKRNSNQITQSGSKKLTNMRLRWRRKRERKDNARSAVDPFSVL